MKNGYESVMVNSNPETLSTDFDVASRLYFEPMNIEYIRNIIRKENPKGEKKIQKAKRKAKRGKENPQRRKENPIR